MMNNKGSAVGIVLMVIALVSLIGVAVLTQSRLDMRLSSSIRNYDKMFSLADGMAAVCARVLLIEGPADIYSQYYEITIYGTGEKVNKYAYQLYPSRTDGNSTFEVNPTTGKHDGDTQYLVQLQKVTYQSQTIGENASTLRLLGWDSDPAAVAGWESGTDGYYPQYWRGEGWSSREKVFGGSINPTSEIRVAETEFTKK